MIFEVLETLKTRKLDADFQKTLAEVLDSTKNATANRAAMEAAAREFERKFGEMTAIRRRCFRPENEAPLCEKWRSFWKCLVESCPNPAVAKRAEKRTIDVLRCLCRSRSSTPSIYQPAEAEVVAPPPSNVPDQLPDCLVNRYDNQVVFTMIRAKKWIKRHPSEHSTVAKEILARLAPNTRERQPTGRLDQWRWRWRHRVGKTAIDLVRIIDRRAMARFDPKKFGPSSLKAVLLHLREDQWLSDEVTKIAEGVIQPPIAPVVIDYLLKAIVDGAALSIGGQLIKIWTAKAKPASIAPALRTVEKVNSAAKKKAASKKSSNAKT